MAAFTVEVCEILAHIKFSLLHFQIKRESKLSRPRKLKLLKEILVVPRKDFEGSSFADFPGIPLPLDPNAIVDGIVPAR